MPLNGIQMKSKQFLLVQQQRTKRSPSTFCLLCSLRFYICCFPQMGGGQSIKKGFGEGVGFSSKSYDQGGGRSLLIEMGEKCWKNWSLTPLQKTKFKIKSNNKAKPWIKALQSLMKKIYEKFLKSRSIQNEKNL